MTKQSKIVITGIGLTCPNGNSLKEFRQSLLSNISMLEKKQLLGLGQVPIGRCKFNEEQYLHKKMRKRGTRAGSILVYCAKESLKNAKIDLTKGIYSPEKVGVFIGTTEHGSMETENEIIKYFEKENKIGFWSHHHNPRTVSNAPAGEVTINLGIKGPHYSIGGACAAGNLGLIHGVQMLKLYEVDLALSGGVSEMIDGISFFASFNAQGALAFNEDATKACKPLDRDREGIVISEGGAIYCLERLENAIEREVPIIAEIIGYSMNSDANDFVNPDSEGQARCIYQAIDRAGLNPNDIDLVNLHATGTRAGDLVETQTLRKVFKNCPNTYFNCTKGFIGHTMGAAGALELAGNLGSFEDGRIHGSKNLNNVDTECELRNIVKTTIENKNVKTILNISFGMLGINSCIIVKKFER